MMDEEVAPGSRVIMLGEWFNYYSYAVYDGEKLELKKYTH
jgi:UDP-2,3-diacylglucosamine hydrolase